MKTFCRIFTSFTLATIIFFSLSGTVYSIGEYTVLVDLPGIEGQTSIESYVPAAFRLSIGIGAALAFVMITFGGIMYATSDAITGKAQGREYVENALWGLLLVVGAWIILNTLNPEILRLKLELPKPDIKNAGTPGVIAVGTPMSPEELAADAAVRNTLTAAGITINANPCPIGQTTGCTNLNGLGSGAVVGLPKLKAACNCNLNITGGTEAGHKTHGVRASIVDTSKDPGLGSFIGKNKIRTVQGKLGPTYTVQIPGDGTFTALDEGNHFHITF